MSTFLLDGRSLQDRSSVRGIGTYLRGLLAGYAELGVAGDVELVLGRGSPVPGEVAQYGLRRPRGRILVVKRRLQPLADPFLVSALLRRLRPSLYHGVEYAQPIATSVPTVITVHDLIPFVFPHLYPWARRERLLALRQLRRADAVIADSQATARDLAAIAHVPPEKIHVVHLGVSGVFRPAPGEVVAAVQVKHGIDRPYVLAVGTFDPRKRIDILAGAMARIAAESDIDLVIAGSQGDFAGNVAATLEAAGVASRTRVIGHVSLDDLVALYTGTSALLFTSAYEGFGLPVLEAMACGAPVVMFGNSSLPEVGGDAAVLVAGEDPAAFGDAAVALLSSPDGIERRRAQGRERAAAFTWRRTAEQTLAVYERVLRG